MDEVKKLKEEVEALKKEVSKLKERLTPEEIKKAIMKDWKPYD